MENADRNRAREKAIQFSKNILYAAGKRGAIGKFESEIGISRGYLSRTASGNKPISLEVAIACADALGYGVEELCEKDLFTDARIADLEREIAELKAGRNAEE